MILTIAFVPTYPASAASYVVTKLADTNDGTCDADCSLREAIAAANGSTTDDTITFSVSGTITLTLGQLSVSNNGTLTIDGGGNITVDGNHASRIFSMAAGTVVELDGLTLTNATGPTSGTPDGGTIVSRGTLTVRNSTISNGYSLNGAGGIGYNGIPGSLTIENSTFTDNQGGNGGAVIWRVASITNSTFTGNRSGIGGALYLNGDGSSVTDSTLTDNHANSGYGGAIYSFNNLTITGSTFSSNSANQGGAIDHGDGLLTIIDSIITGNTSNTTGGAIYQESTNNNGISITGSSIQDNVAANGGAIRFGNTTNTRSVTNSCIVGNGDTAVLFTGSNPGVIATGNWWGSPSGPFSGLSSPAPNDSGTVDSYGDSVTQSIDPSLFDYSSYLTSAPTDCFTCVFAGVSNGSDRDLRTCSLGAVITPTPDVSISPATVNVAEGSNTDFTITRTGGDTTAALSIDVTITRGTGTTASGYTLSGGSISGQVGSQTITIPAGQASVNVNFAATDDVDAEAANTLTIALVDGAAYNLGATTSSTATIPANDFVVTNTNDSGDGSLRQAILNANAFNSDDTITFAASANGTITLASALPNLANNGTLTITGNGTANTILNGADTYRHFDINSGANLTLNDLTLEHGRQGAGGAIYALGNLTVNNSLFRDNVSPAGNSGGAIYANGALTVNDSTFDHNSAATGGGAISTFAAMSITGSTFTNNNAAVGAAVYSSGTGTIANSTFSGQTVTLSGAVYNEGTLTVVNSVFSGNSGTNGGAIANRSTLTLINSTVSGNSATNGGVFNDNSGTLNLRNSILANNLSGGDCYRNSGTINIQNSLIEDGSCGIVNGTNGNVVYDPALNGDLTLSITSRAINGGDNSFISGYSTDLANNARVQQTTIDMGAFESPYPPYVPGAVNLSKSFTDDPVIPGATVTLEFTLTNSDTNLAATGISFTDDLDATLTGLVATGLPASNVCGAGSTISGTSLLTLTGGSLAAGANCVITVTLQVPVSAAVNTYSNTTSTVSATTNGLSTSGTAGSDDLVVSAAPAPEIAVLDGATPIPDGSGTVNAGTTTVGTPITKTLTIDNSAGTATLTLSAPVFTGDFSLSGVFPSAIAAGASDTFDVQCDATSEAAASGTITFANNDADENPYNFALTCTVAAAPVMTFGIAGGTSTVEGNSGTHTVDLTVTRDDTSVGGSVDIAFTGTANGADYSAAISGTGISYSAPTITFAAGASSATVTLTINGDTMLEPDETVIATLSNPSSSLDVALGTTQQTVTISNDDSAALTIADVDQAEGNSGTSTMSFTVTLNNAVQGGFTVDYATTNGTATAVGSDYVSTTGSLTFAGTASETHSIDVTIIGDLVAEADETFTVSLSSPSVSAVDVTDTATGTILNDDTAGVTIAPTSIAFTEGSSASFNVSLNTTPSGQVDITVTPGPQCDIGGGLGVADVLSFTSSAPQTVTVSAPDNAIADGSRNCAISLAITTSAAIEYPTGALSGVTATINDDDTAGVTITPTSIAFTEGSSDSFSVSLNTTPSGQVDITVTPGPQCDIGGGLGVADVLSFTSTAAQTVTVSAPDNAIADGSRNCAISLTITSSAAIEYPTGALSGVTATINDDDTAGVTISPTTIAFTEGGSDSFSVSLNTTPSGQVDITVTPGPQCDVGAGLGVAGVLSFTSSTPQTVTVSAPDNAIADGSRNCTISLAITTSAAIEYPTGALSGVTVTISDNDAAGVTVNPTNGLVTTESGGTDSFTVVLDTQPTADVTIPLSSSNTAEGTIDKSSLTFTSGNWDTPQPVTVTGVDDAIVDGSVAYTIQINASTSADPYYDGIDPADVSVTNNDNDTAGITVSPTTISITEGGSSADFTVSANTAPANPVTVSLSTDAQCSTPASVILPAGSTAAQTVTVTAVDDASAEGDHTCAITTGSSSSSDSFYDGLTVSDVTATVTDNDAQFSIASDQASVAEGTGTGNSFSFTVTRTGAAQLAASVDLAYSGASEGTDFSFTSVSAGSLTSGTLSFPANVTSITVTYTTIPNISVQANRTLTITLSSSTISGTGSLGTSSAATTITDDDVAGVTISPTSGSLVEGGSTTYMVVLNTQPSAGADVMISVTTGNAETNISAPLLIFTPSNWDTPQTITLSVADNALVDGARPAIITHSATSADSSYNSISISDYRLVINDNDSAGVMLDPTAGSVIEGGSTTYAVVLTSQPSADVTIALATGSSETTIDLPTLTFTSGNWDTPQTVTLSVADNALADGTRTATIAHTASSGDGNYDGISISDFTLTITDDDSPGVVIDPTTGTANEGSSTTYTVVLTSQPSTDVTIALATASGETTIDLPTLTFTSGDWDTPQTVTLSVADNSVADGTRSATITHTASSSDGSYDGITVSDFTLTIADDDSPGLTIDPTAGSVNEGGSTTYTVVLNTQPANDVTVTLTADRGEITVNPPTLTFTSGDWDTPRTVTLSVADNAAFDGDRTGIITHATSSADANYDALTADFTLAIADDDVPGSTTVQPTAAPSSQNPPEILRLIGLPEPGGAALLFPGSTTVWTFTIQNISTADANNVTALVTYPDDDMVGVSATSDRGSEGTFAHGSLLTNYDLGTLHPGEIVTLTITTQLPNRGGTFVGTLTANANGSAQSSTATLTRVAIGGLPSTGETPWWRDLAPTAAGMTLLAGVSILSLRFWWRKRQLP